MKTQILLPNLNLDEMQKTLVSAALKQTNGNLVAAATELGITPAAVRRRATRLGLGNLLPSS